MDAPGLEAVRAAAQKPDWPAAETAFAAYIRAREKPVWFGISISGHGGGRPAIGLRFTLHDGRLFLYAQRHGKAGLMRWEDYESDAEAAMVEWREGQSPQVIAADG